MFNPESTVEVIKVAMFVGFIGIGFGALIGVSCRVIMSTVNIFNKIVK